MLLFAQAPQSKDPGRTAQRVGSLRGFLRYLAGFEPATEVPPPALLGCGIRRRPPHIYTPSERQALLLACERLRPRCGLRAHTYKALFSVLFCTGLRISEALHLLDSDVDLASGLLTVHDSKFGKSRLVPLHPTALEPLLQYVDYRNRVTPGSTSFFRTEPWEPLHYAAVLFTFQGLRERLGWSAAGRARCPRIQDIRHTFAVECLLRWYREGIQPERKMAQLATYLGHTEVRDTYWYLSVVPELMALAVERFERFARQGQQVKS